MIGRYVVAPSTVSVPRRRLKTRILLFISQTLQAILAFLLSEGVEGNKKPMDLDKIRVNPEPASAHCK